MSQSNEENSRATRNQKRTSDRLANWLIAAVVIGIFITGWMVLSPDGSVQHKEESLEQEEGDGAVGDSEPPREEPAEQLENEMEDEPALDSEDKSIEIIEDSPDSFVSESRIDPTWEPIGTTQSGEHVSLYDGDSVDWKEKEQALLYATGLTEEDVIFWKIKNGGSHQQSVGIVSSKDQVEKYRVHLEWVDKEGWKPVRLDVLNTLEFDF